MAGFDPNEPRDQQGRWTGASNDRGRFIAAVRRAGLRRIVPANPQFAYTMITARMLRGGKVEANLIVPSSEMRRTSKARDYMPYKVAHEIGHSLISRGGVGEISTERDAWAAGMRWARKFGLKPRLGTLKEVLGRTLATYGEKRGGAQLAIGTPRQRLGIKPSSYNSHHRLLKMK